MFKCNKKLISFAIIISSINFAIAASHKTLPNYTELLNALVQGDEIRAVIAFNKCSPLSGNAKDTNDSLGGMNFNNFNKYKIQTNGQAKDVIATSVTLLTQHSQHGPVYNYVRLHVFEDGTTEVLSQILDPKNYALLGQATFACHLGNDKEQNSITLYDLS